MQDAFGVDREKISKGLFKPAVGAMKQPIKGSWKTRHFPKRTAGGRRQLREQAEAKAASRAAADAWNAPFKYAGKAPKRTQAAMERAFPSKAPASKKRDGAADSYRKMRMMPSSRRKAAMTQPEYKPKFDGVW